MFNRRQMSMLWCLYLYKPKKIKLEINHEINKIQLKKTRNKNLHLNCRVSQPEGKRAALWSSDAPLYLWSVSTRQGGWVVGLLVSYGICAGASPHNKAQKHRKKKNIYGMNYASDVCVVHSEIFSLYQPPTSSHDLPLHLLLFIYLL